MRYDRRTFLSRAGSGCGMLALSSMLRAERAGGETSRAMATKEPPARSVIWLFMNGGPSSIDLFDPKPALKKLHGKPFPGKIETLFPYPGTVMQSPFSFSRHGECGAPVSNVFPNLAKHVDDITFLKACVSREQNHVPACYVANTGNRQVGAPHVGSWATYGLGNERRDLPEFVVMYDHRAAPEGGANLWSSGFLPGRYQGVPFKAGETPILYGTPPEDLTKSTQHRQRELLQWMNRRHAVAHRRNTELEARIHSFETAYVMQSSVPELTDLSKESAATKRLYGLEDPDCRHFGAQCLLARRMVQRGVPFIQLYHGGYESNWDQHGGLAEGHARNCRETDTPIAGLLTDLKQRGMLDSTLVVWGGEFGRTPTAQDRDGRDHNPHGFTMWMAGGGMKGGISYGQTDELGYLPVENAVSMRDVHATILHQLGIDETQLTFRHGGREQTATNGLGSVITEVLA